MEDTTLLALDINSGAVSGVLVAQRRRSTAILAAHCLVVNRETDLERALTEVVERCGGRGQRCAVSLDGCWMHHRSLRLPFSDAKKVRSILPYELEDALCTDSNDFVYDYLGVPDDDGTDIVAVMAEKELIGSWLTRLRGAGVSTETITVSGIAQTTLMCRMSGLPPDFLLLQTGFGGTQLFYVRDRAIRLIRPLPAFRWPVRADADGSEAVRLFVERLGEELDRTTGALELPVGAAVPDLMWVTGPAARAEIFVGSLAEVTGRTVKDADLAAACGAERRELLTGNGPGGGFDQALSLAHLSVKERSAVNFRKGIFAAAGASGSRRRWKNAAVAAAVAGCILAVGGVLDYHRLKNERDRLTEEIAALYRQTVPDKEPGQDPLRKLQIEIGQLQLGADSGAGASNDSVVRVLADISRRVPAGLQVVFERLLYEPKSVRIHGTADSYNTVDRIRHALQTSTVFTGVSIDSATVDPQGQRVRFELTCER